MIEQKLLKQIRTICDRLIKGQEKIDAIRALAVSLQSAPEDAVMISVFDNNVHIPRDCHSQLIDVLVNAQTNQRKENEELEYELTEIFRRVVPYGENLDDYE